MIRLLLTQLLIFSTLLFGVSKQGLSAENDSSGMLLMLPALLSNSKTTEEPPPVVENTNYYHVYIPEGDEINTSISALDYGYFPDKYAKDAGYQYVGKASGTATISFPKNVNEFMLHVPAGNSVKLDAIELISDGITIFYIGYTADGKNVSWGLQTGNSPKHAFVRGKPDGLYSWLGKQYPNIDHPSFFIVPPISEKYDAIKVHISSQNLDSEVFWDTYLTGYKPISETDKNQITQVVDDIVNGYRTDNRELILKHYRDSDKEKISNELDVIFTEYDYDIQYGIYHIVGELPYAYVLFDLSKTYGSYYVEPDGGCHGDVMSEIVFTKLNGQWKVFHDYDGPHTNALDCMSRTGYYTYW